MILDFILNKRYFIFLILFFLSLLLSNILELIGLSSILIFLNYLIGIEQNLFTDLFFFLDKFNSSYFKINQTTFFLILILSVFFIKTFFSIFVMYLREYLSLSLANFFSYKLYQNYFSKHLNFFLKNSIYEIYRNIMSEARKVSDYIFLFVRIFADLLTLIFISFFIFLTNKNLFFLLIFIILPSMLIYFFITNKQIIKNSKTLVTLRTKVIKIIIDNIELIFESRFFNIFDKFENIFFRKLQIYKKSQVIVSTINQLPRTFNEIIILAAVISIFSYLAFLEYTNLEIISITSIFVITSLRILPSVNSILTNINKIKEASISYKVVKDDLFEEKNNYIFKKISRVSRISISNISYSYNQKKIIGPINIIFQDFNMIGLKGESGCGKSTFVKILLNILKVKKGSVIFNNRHKLNENVYYNFSYLDSKSQLIDGTIKKNILFFSKEDKKKLKKVMNIACLPEKFLNKISKKNDIDRISTGQKQRVLLARSLYKDPSLIIMDEILSNVDNMNSIKILKKLKEFKIPTILITHNLQYLKFCDIKYEVKNKKIYKI